MPGPASASETLVPCRRGKGGRWPGRCRRPSAPCLHPTGNFLSEQDLNLAQQACDSRRSSIAAGRFAPAGSGAEGGRPSAQWTAELGVTRGLLIVLLRRRRTGSRAPARVPEAGHDGCVLLQVTRGVRAAHLRDAAHRRRYAGARLRGRQNNESRQFPLDAIPELHETIDRQLEATRKLAIESARVIPWLFHNIARLIVDLLGCAAQRLRRSRPERAHPARLPPNRSPQPDRRSRGHVHDCQLVGWEGPAMLKGTRIERGCPDGSTAGAGFGTS
jgi:hypothetical protein